MKTFYDVLKISRNASREEILEAYRKRCIETHPDKGGKEIDFLNVRKGYEILSSPTKRAEYDKWILQKEKEELEKQIQELKIKKEKYENNKSKNIKHSILYSFIYTIIGLLVLGFILFSYNNMNDKVTIDQKSNTQSSDNTYLQDKDSKWLYNELAKDINWIGTYDEFLQELKDPIMIGYFYREAKRLKLQINSPEEFNQLLLKEAIINEPVRIKTNTEDIKTLLTTEKTIKNTIPKYNLNNDLKRNIKSNSEISYKETIYKTGDSPYANYYGDGKGYGQFDKNSLSKLTIKNYSSNEAVVLLEKKNGTVIRNVYISNNSQYCLTNIPEGYYKIKVMYGNSWNSEKNNGTNLPKGGFMKNVSFTKSKNNDLFDYTFENSYDGISYPTYSITLHKVRNGNMETVSIDKEDFFN